MPISRDNVLTWLQDVAQTLAANREYLITKMSELIKSCVQTMPDEISATAHQPYWSRQALTTFVLYCENITGAATHSLF